MKKLVFGFGLLFIVTIFMTTVQAQVLGSIAGTVRDSAGAVVPGASVIVKGEAGQEFSVTTNGDGVYNIPAVAAGFYTATITAPNFKTSIVQNIKVDVGTPATVDAMLEAGQVSETVIVTSGAEVLQTQTATVGTNIQGRQILETPIQSRDALDLVTLLPGTTTTGVVRTSSINGLPKSAITIQIDGVDVQDNFLKSSDGFFTFIRPRIDAIDEVTVSTSNPGAEASGDGAIGINFATRRGTDDYKGSVFWQHRDEGLNAANFQNNYNGLSAQKLRLNQFGGSVGGPIPFLKFGESDELFDSGKGKRYFFVNYERFHLNEQSPPRTRTFMTAAAQSGVFRYGPGGSSMVNIFDIASAPTAPPGTPNTIDPTVAAMLAAINGGVGSGVGTIRPLNFGGTGFNTQQLVFSNSGEQRRRFLVARIDANITKDHAIEGIYNDQPFRSNVDFLNSVDPAFPGIANAGTQQSDRRSLSIGLRSSFGSNVVNQFRYAQLAGWLGGASNFDLVGGSEYFDTLMGGRSVSIANALGSSNPTIRNAFSSRSSPTRDITNNVTWIKGNHTFTFGGQIKKVQTISDSTGLFKPTVTLGLAAGDALPVNLFTTTTVPGATAAELTSIRQFYSTMTGRISAVGSNAVLGPDGQYAVNGPRHFEIEENTNGIFGQDSWRIRPNLTVTFGLRWQPQTGAKMLTQNYSLLVDPDMVYDISGPGNLFTPGTLTGVLPQVRGNEAGEKAFEDDLNNFAPSVGVVWSPDFASGFMRTLFGANGTSVFRGGFARAFIREGTLIVENSVGQNPGGQFAINRSTALANLTVGTLLRTPGNPNLTPPPFNATPVFPRNLTAADAALGFAPDFRSGFVDSWSIGYQREINRDTVVEFRYVGNRGKDLQLQYTLNEVNAIENGFGAEFALAQQNLLANIAAGRTVGGAPTFGYFGPGTGTVPLPIMVSFLQPGNPDPNNIGSYGVSFTDNNALIGGLASALTTANPNVLGFAAALANNGTTRARGLAAGRPANFFHNCPTTLGFCFQFDNSERSWYDAGIVEVRRRLANGLRFQASYTYGKSFTNAYASAGTLFFGLGAGDQSNAGNVTLRNPGLDKSYSQVDVRHAFKMDATWDLPFGKGRSFLSSSNWWSNALFGGWSIVPTMRWQSGAPILMENINLVGMTRDELQDAVGVYFNQTITQPNGSTRVDNVSFLPADIIENTMRAFTTSATASGYTFGAPTGRFIAPAGFGNCQQRSPGTCGFRKFVLYGPDFFKVDAAIIKRIQFDERRNVEFRVTMFDVLNKTNWRLGGWTGNVNNITAFTGTFGQMAGGWSYQDPNGSNDPGGRLVDLMMRINF
jgi:hypothetical protein